MVNCDNDFNNLTKVATICFGSINIIIGILSLCGNAMVFYIFYRHESLRNHSNYCLLSLALTDFLVGAFLEPIYVIQIFSKMVRLNCILITLRRFLSALLFGASMSSVALISYDRYLHLSKTTQYSQYMNKRKIIILIILCWLLPGLSPVLTVIGSGNSIFSAVIFIYTFGMLIVIIASYFMIIRIVKKKESQVNESTSQPSRNNFRNSSNAMRVSKAVASVIICFVAFNAPISVYLALVAFGNISGRNISGLNSKQQDIFYLSVLTVSMANSTINAAIYYLRIPGFKQKINRHLRRFIRSSNIVLSSSIPTESDNRDISN